MIESGKNVSGKKEEIKGRLGDTDTDKQTERNEFSTMERQTDGRTDRQTDKQTEVEPDLQTNIKGTNQSQALTTANEGVNQDVVVSD